MRYFFIFSLLASQSLFAQTYDYKLPFAYKIGNNVHTFTYSYGGDALEPLPTAVKKTYNAKQKRANTKANFVEVVHDTAGKAEKYYTINEYFDNQQDRKELTYLYDAKGKLLYSISPVPVEDKQFWSKVQGVITKYASNDADTDISGVTAYKIQSSEKGSPAYTIEFGWTKLKAGYAVKENEKKEGEETSFRVLLDAKMQVIKEMMLFGDGTSVGEMSLAAPIFWK